MPFFVKKDCRKLILCKEWRMINLWDLVGSLDYICGLFNNSQGDLGVKTGGKRGVNINFFAFFVKKDFRNLKLCREWKITILWDLVGSLKYICCPTKWQRILCYILYSNQGFDIFFRWKRQKIGILPLISPLFWPLNPSRKYWNDSKYISEIVLSLRE